MIIWALFCVGVLSIANKESSPILVSKVKTDKLFQQPSLNSSNIYFIEMQKIGTNRESESNKCKAHPKQIQEKRQFQKFRSQSQTGKKNTVYQSLTTLPDRKNGIQSFKILNNKLMLIMMSGKVYFLQNDRSLQISTTLTEIQLKMQLSAGRQKLQPLIAGINDNAYVATPRELSFCQPKFNRCTKIEGFKGVDVLYNLLAFQYKNKHYVYFLTGLEIIGYQISSNGIAQNQKTYNAQFFNKTKLFLLNMVSVENEKVLLLDYYSGIIQVEHSSTNMLEFKTQQTVYEQYGCTHLTFQKGGEYLALQCSLTQKTYFILQLVRSKNQSRFQAQQPIFFNQVLTGISSSKQVIMANIFSGVKLYWRSSNIQGPYPYEFQNAGSIFLHNAKGAEMGILQSKPVIYIFTQDQLRIYELSIKSPQIICYSPVTIKQEYKVTYTYLCQKQSTLHLKVCNKQIDLRYQAWEHHEVSMKSTLLPLIFSFGLAIIILIVSCRLYRNYKKEVEAARLKYSSEEDFVIDG